MFQNAEKLNGACETVMMKSLHDNLSRVTMILINTEKQSSDKHMIHPTRSKVHADSFAETIKICIKNALLECERIFFDNKREKTFAESNAECCIDLLDRERAMIVLDESVFWSRSVFDNFVQWN